MYDIICLIIVCLICFLYISYFDEIMNKLDIVYDYTIGKVFKERFGNVNNKNRTSNFNKLDEMIKDFKKEQSLNQKNSLEKGGNNNDMENSDKSVLEMNKYNTSNTKDLIYFYNDTINQSNINENSYDVVNQIDLIDYSKVKTGIQKCKEQCDGTCFEMGYTGTATCYPKQKQPFDYGTLYKNPTFSYGTNAYKNVNN